MVISRLYTALGGGGNSDLIWLYIKLPVRHFSLNLRLGNKTKNDYESE